MKSKLCTLGFSQALCLLLLPLLPASAKTSASSQRQRPVAEHLFIVVANGIRYNDAFGHKMHLYTEKIRSELRPLGTVCTRLYNNGSTWPLPSQASLLTGVRHKKFTPTDTNFRPTVPTLFEYWTRTKGAGTCYFAANREQYRNLAHSEHEEYGESSGALFNSGSAESGNSDPTEDKIRPAISGNEIYEKAVAHIFTHHPSMVVLNLDSGSVEQGYPHDHAHPPGTPGCEGEATSLNAYYESIILTDTIVYDLWNRIQHDDIYKGKTLLVFLSAYGRNSNNYRIIGDNSRGCRHLNFLITGPGIRKGFISKKKRTLIDICPTIGALLGLPVPSAKGKIMKELFE